MNPKTLKSLVQRWGPALLMMVAIFIASSIPKKEMPTFGLWDLLVKKGGHMVGYALLAVAYLHALTRKSGGQSANLAQVIWAILLAGLYGATDEFHQLFVAGRGASLMDVLIDTVGAMVGAGVSVAIGRRLGSTDGTDRTDKI
jgi:hypothetical protein